MTKPIPIQGKDGKFAGSIGAGKTDIPTPSETPTALTADGTPVTIQPPAADVYDAYQQLRIEGEVERRKEQYGPQGVEVAAFFKWVQKLKRADTARILAYQKATDPAQLKEQEAIHGILLLSVTDARAANPEALDERTTQLLNVLKRSNDVAWDAPVKSFPLRFESKWGAKRKFREISDQTSLALAMRDQISKEWYDTLTRPWRTCFGPIHPNDDKIE